MPFVGAILKWFVGPLAGPVLGIALLITGIGFVTDHLVLSWKLSNVTADRDALKDSIYHDGTGWVARTSACETNVEVLTQAVKNARDDIKSLADNSDAASARAAKMLATIAAQVSGVRASAEKLLALPPSAPVGTLDACHAGANILKRGAP